MSDKEKTITSVSDDKKCVTIQTAGSYGPRGEYYSWVKVYSSGIIEFGEEQGNYAGGTLCSPEFYEHIAPTYWIAAQTYIKWWKESHPELIEKAFEVLENFGVLDTVKREIMNSYIIASNNYLTYKGKDYSPNDGYVKVCRPALDDLIQNLDRQILLEKIITNGAYDETDLQETTKYFKHLLKLDYDTNTRIALALEKSRMEIKQIKNSLKTFDFCKGSFFKYKGDTYILADEIDGKPNFVKVVKE